MSDSTQNFGLMMEIVQERLQELGLLVSDIRSASGSSGEDADLSLNRPVPLRVVDPLLMIPPHHVAVAAGACGGGWIDLGDSVSITDATARLELALRNCAEVVKAANLQRDEAEG